MNVHHAASGIKSRITAPAFVWPHTVGFGETNVMGNVYFARHFDWHGACREMFLKTHCPSILDDIAGDLRLVTLNAYAEFLAELFAFDDIELHMRLGFLQQHRIGLRFDVMKKSDGGWSAAASGAQDIACMRLCGRALEPTPIPDGLLKALLPFGAAAARR